MWGSTYLFGSIIEGASQGKGRGKQVIAVARTADLVLFMLDASKGDTQRALLEKELYALLVNFSQVNRSWVLCMRSYSVGIRLNCKPPNISFKVFVVQTIWLSC